MADGWRQQILIRDQEKNVSSQPEREREQAKWTLKHCWICYMLPGCWTEDQRLHPKVCTCKLISSIWKLSNKNWLSRPSNWRGSFPSFNSILKRAGRFHLWLSETLESCLFGFVLYSTWQPDRLKLTIQVPFQTGSFMATVILGFMGTA